MLIDLYTEKRSYNKQFQPALIKKFRIVIHGLMRLEDLKELRINNGLNYEQLKGDRKGTSSIRLNHKYRLIFKEIFYKDDIQQIEFLELLEISNHYQ
jgi:proteic killer suppression protein